MKHSIFSAYKSAATYATEMQPTSYYRIGSLLQLIEHAAIFTRNNPLKIMVTCHRINSIFRISTSFTKSNEINVPNLKLSQNKYANIDCNYNS